MLPDDPMEHHKVEEDGVNHWANMFGGVLMIQWKGLGVDYLSHIGRKDEHFSI